MDSGNEEGGDDTSLTGWGAVHEGNAINGVETPQLHITHINYLKLLTVFLSLRHFRPSLWNCYVLIRTDNTTVVAYINRRGGTRSLRLHRLSVKIILLSRAYLLSLRVTHVPRIINVGADLLSRGNPHHGEWRLQVVKLIWERYGHAFIDLFASHENAHCLLFFVLAGDAPLGVDGLAHPWPRVMLYTFPPLSLILPTLVRVREEGSSSILLAPQWPGKLWVAEIILLLYDESW